MGSESGVSWIFVGICWVECNGDDRGVGFGVGVGKSLILKTSENTLFLTVFGTPLNQ